MTLIARYDEAGFDGRPAVRYLEQAAAAGEMAALAPVNCFGSPIDSAGTPALANEKWSERKKLPASGRGSGL